MPLTDDLKNSDKRALMAGKSGDGAASLIIPEVPFVELPDDAARRMPSLAKWNRDHYAAWTSWRERSNAALVRSAKT